MVVEVMETEIEGGRPFTVDELPAYLAVVKHEGEARRLIAVVQKGPRYFVFKGENTREGFDDAFLRAFSATVLSFRRMRQADLAEATTTRVQLYLATPEDSYESLAAALRLGPRGADRLRLLNGDYPRGQPRAGDWLKVIR
jgi:predicted Zn-dependent protease